MVPGMFWVRIDLRYINNPSQWKMKRDVRSGVSVIISSNEHPKSSIGEDELTTQVMHAPRPRVHLMGGDGGGWALDDDLAQTRAALAGAIEEADLGTADILHSVWWVPLLSLSAAQLARKRVICHLSGDVGRYLEHPRFHAVLGRVDRWISQSQQARRQLAELGIDSSYAPYAVDRNQFRPIGDRGQLSALRDRYEITSGRYLRSEEHTSEPQ